MSLLYQIYWPKYIEEHGLRQIGQTQYLTIITTEFAQYTRWEMSCGPEKQKQTSWIKRFDSLKLKCVIFVSLVSPNVMQIMSVSNNPQQPHQVPVYFKTVKITHFTFNALIELAQKICHLSLLRNDFPGNSPFQTKRLFIMQTLNPKWLLYPRLISKENIQTNKKPAKRLC